MPSCIAPPSKPGDRLRSNVIAVRRHQSAEELDVDPLRAEPG